MTIASSQGQKIFTITQAHQDIILPQINVAPDVMTEMQNALSIGKEVTVHQSPITQSGWTGTRYIITDPATGAGDYKISGGANGGLIIPVAVNVLGIIGIGTVLLLAPESVFAAAIFGSLVIVYLILLIYATDTEYNVCDGLAGAGLAGGILSSWSAALETNLYKILSSVFFGTAGWFSAHPCTF
jgi:hypothetical protein